MNSPDRALQDKVAEALIRIQDTRTVVPLIALLEESYEEEEQQRAAEALQKLGGEKAEEALRRDHQEKR